MTQHLDEVRQLARELLALGDEDPHTPDERLVQSLNREQRAALLRYGADRLLLELNRWARNGTVMRAAAGEAATGESWKASVSSADLLAQRFYVDGNWKLLGDCTGADVLAIAEGYRDRAARNVAHAEAFERLAADMDAAGAATVGDLYAVAV